MRNSPIFHCSSKDGTRKVSFRKSVVTKSCIIVEALVDLDRIGCIKRSLLIAYFQKDKS